MAVMRKREEGVRYCTVPRLMILVAERKKLLLGRWVSGVGGRQRKESGVRLGWERKGKKALSSGGERDERYSPSLRYGSTTLDSTAPYGGTPVQDKDKYVLRMYSTYSSSWMGCARENGRPNLTIRIFTLEFSGLDACWTWRSTFAPSTIHICGWEGFTEYLSNKNNGDVFSLVLGVAVISFLIRLYLLGGSAIPHLRSVGGLEKTRLYCVCKPDCPRDCRSRNRTTYVICGGGVLSSLSCFCLVPLVPDPPLVAGGCEWEVAKCCQMHIEISLTAEEATGRGIRGKMRNRRPACTVLGRDHHAL
jgi:hypothetical protein